MNLTPVFSSRNDRLLSTLFQVAASLFLAAGLAGGVQTASAQVSSASAEGASAQWTANFDLQVAHELRRTPSMRDSFLQVVIDQAPKNEDLRLPRTVEALLHIIESDASQQHRLMAVQALSTIGVEHVGEKRYNEAMSHLYALAEDESSERVRGAMADAINRYQAS